MADSMNGGAFVALIKAIYEAVNATQAELNALDSALGDGDHGGALATAFAEAADKTAALDQPTPSAVLATTAQALLNRMGGASGALYGTMFLRMSTALNDYTAADYAAWSAALTAGAAGVQARGKAAVGDKTLVDALVPAVAAFAQADNLGDAFAQAAAAAHAGAQETAAMIAKFGRAKFVGERAIGHVDAGARSMAVVFEALHRFWEAQYDQA